MVGLLIENGLHTMICLRKQHPIANVTPMIKCCKLLVSKFCITVQIFLLFAVFMAQLCRKESFFLGAPTFGMKCLYSSLAALFSNLLKQDVSIVALNTTESSRHLKDGPNDLHVTPLSKEGRSSCLYPQNGPLVHSLQAPKVSIISKRSCISKGPSIAQEVDAAIIPAVDKAVLRENIAKLQKRILEGAKAAGAANKRQAVESAVAAAQDAAASSKGFLVTQLDVGIDSKAVQEAYKAVRDAQPNLPALFVTADSTGKKRALVYGGVPDALTQQLPAGEWVKAALEPLGGKCGPNPKLSQGQGPNFAKVPSALEAAEAFAVAKLKGWK